MTVNLLSVNLLLISVFQASLSCPVQWSLPPPNSGDTDGGKALYLQVIGCMCGTWGVDGVFM